jgi:hypothetical protein
MVLTPDFPASSMLGKAFIFGNDILSLRENHVERLRGDRENPQDADFCGAAEDGFKNSMECHEWIPYYP